MTIENADATIPTPDTPAADPVPSADEQVLSALDQGFTEAATPAEPAPPATPEGGQPPGTTAAAPAPAEATATPADGKTTAAATAPAPEPDAAVEKEITDRGLKGDTATRFRELANQVRELAPVKDALDKAGVKDLAELPKLVEHASFGRELYQQVQATGANAEQYGQALDYLAFVNKANGGDLKAARICYDMMKGELGNLAKMLGEEVPGIHDPLADYPDLKQLVEDEEMPRAQALETARLRTAQAMGEASRTAAATKQEQATQQQAALDKAATDLNTLGAELAAIDPHYAAKAPVLLAQLKAIKDALPPGQWVAKARALYATIPTPVAAAPAPAPAPPARPAPGPMRGAALHAGLMPQTDDPMEALEQAFK